MSNIIREVYSISSQMEYLNQLIDDAGGEITPEIEEALTFTHEAFVARSRDLINSILGAEAMAKLVGDRIAELAKLKQRLERRAEVLKGATSRAMEASGLDHLDLGENRLSWRTSKAVEIENEALIPNEYTKVKVEVDKKALRAYLAAGNSVSGARLVYRKNLQVK